MKPGIRRGEVARAAPPGDVYWIVTRSGHHRVGSGAHLLTMEHGVENVLPVFSFREEAEVFFSLFPLEKPGRGWRIRRTTTEELISVLTGPGSGVDSVALDPVADQDFREILPLVSLSRERFLFHLVTDLAEVIRPADAELSVLEPVFRDSGRPKSA